MGKRLRLWFLLIAAAAAAVAIFWFARRLPIPPTGPVAAPWHLLPASCEATVVVPDPGRLGEKLALLPKLKLAQLGASLAGAGDPEELVALLAREAGFDPRSRESMKGAGIDPARPLAVSMTEGAPVVAVPATDGAKLAALVERQLAARAGASHRSTRPAGKAEIVILAASPSGGAVFSYALSRGYLLGAAGLKSSEAIAAALSEVGARLDADAKFLGVAQRMAGNEAYAYLCGPAGAAPTAGGAAPSPANGAAAAGQAPAGPGDATADLPRGAAIGATLSERQIGLVVDAPLPAGARIEARAAPEQRRLLERLDPGSFAVVWFGADPAALKPVLPALLPGPFARAARAAELDVNTELLDNLQPGFAVALKLAPTARLEGIPALDPRLTNPFAFVHLQAIARVRDAARADQTLQKVALAAPRFGAQMTERTVGTTKAWTAGYRLGEGATFALQGDLALLTGGAGQLEALLARLAASDAPLELREPEARQAVPGAAFLAYLDVARLAAAVRALPDSAYGIGGFAIKAAVLRWLEAVEEIASIRIVATPAAGSVHSELVLTLSPRTAEKGP